MLWVSPALLELALDYWLLGSLALARQQPPQLKPESVSGQLRLGHPEPVGGRPLASSVYGSAKLGDVEAHHE
eukprot:14413461-Alexandrium_andersonii.AAC.1